MIALKISPMNTRMDPTITDVLLFMYTVFPSVKSIVATVTDPVRMRSPLRSGMPGA